MEYARMKSFMESHENANTSYMNEGIKILELCILTLGLTILNYKFDNSKILYIYAKFFIFSFYVFMRIFPQQIFSNNINIPQNKKITFCGSFINNKSDVFIRSSNDWIELRELLNKKAFEYEYLISSEEQEIIKKAVPILEKLNFTKNDYNNLSKKERLILDNIVNKGKELQSAARKDLSISKDAQRILFIARITKERLDKKYPNGYKLISIGNSPAPFVETMQLLGADAFVMPFSRNLVTGIFPFEQRTHGNTTKHYTKENWINYFNHFNLNSDLADKTGKQIIFTDYAASGATIEEFFEPLLRNLNYPEKVKVANIFEIFNNLREHQNADEILGKFSLAQVIDFSDYKKFSATPSARNMKFNPFLNPELLKLVEQPFHSKLLRYALWKLLK